MIWDNQPISRAIILVKNQNIQCKIEADWYRQRNERKQQSNSDQKGNYKIWMRCRFVQINTSHCCRIISYFSLHLSNHIVIIICQTINSWGRKIFKIITYEYISRSKTRGFCFWYQIFLCRLPIGNFPKYFVVKCVCILWLCEYILFNLKFLYNQLYHQFLNFCFPCFYLFAFVIFIVSM